MSSKKQGPLLLVAVIVHVECIIWLGTHDYNLSDFLIGSLWFIGTIITVALITWASYLAVTSIEGSL